MCLTSSIKGEVETSFFCSPYDFALHKAALISKKFTCISFLNHLLNVCFILHSLYMSLNSHMFIILMVPLVETFGRFMNKSVFTSLRSLIISSIWIVLFSVFAFSHQSLTLLSDLVPFPDLDKFLLQISLGAWTGLYKYSWRCTVQFLHKDGRM